MIAVCTLVFLFSLQQAGHIGEEGVQNRRKDMALGFMSLAFTVAVLAVTVVGTDQLTRVAHTVWSHVSGTVVNSTLVGGARKRTHGGDPSFGVVVPVHHEKAAYDEKAVAAHEGAK